MPACSTDADGRSKRPQAALDTTPHKSESEAVEGRVNPSLDDGLKACPTPRAGWFFVRPDTGELVPIPCKRNGCPFCSRRNASINAAMLGLDAAERCPTIAATTTTRDAV